MTRQTMTISGRLMSYIFNPPGDRLIQGHGWPEGAKVRGARYDAFNDTFDFLVEWPGDDDLPEAAEPWNHLMITWSTQIACQKCGERFAVDSEDIADGSK